MIEGVTAVAVILFVPFVATCPFALTTLLPAEVVTVRLVALTAVLFVLPSLIVAVLLTAVLPAPNTWSYVGMVVLTAV